MTDARCDIYRLSVWFSPAFPIGAYSWSSGLEYAVETGIVADSASLKSWLIDTISFGTGAIDGAIFCHAHRAAADGDPVKLAECLDWAEAQRSTSELANESAALGEAFLKVMRDAWPHQGLDVLAALVAERNRRPGYAVAAGASCGCHGIAIDVSIAAFFHSIVANLVSAAVRAVPLGQTDGQIVTAALEPVLASVAATAKSAGIDSVGTATPMADWVSMQHETQYTRLFRS